MGNLQPSLLLDTNVFYACVDISPTRRHADSDRATRLLELANRHGCEVWLSAATRRDIGRTSSSSLREASHLRMRQWNILDPLEVPQDLITRAGYTKPLSPNDDVDSHMLAAISSNAADFLISQDRRLRRHAQMAGLGNRVMTIQGGIELLERLFDEPTTYPTVRQLKGYQLNSQDPVFESLRSDYDGFDIWLQKVQREHRDCFVIGEASEGLDALSILKTETDQPHGLQGKVLKVCTFKVADRAVGAKRGELLLKSTFGYAREGNFDKVYLEVLPCHDALVALLKTFGFRDPGKRTRRGEMVFAKDLYPTPNDSPASPLEFNRRYGPGAVLVSKPFVIPIQPRWHRVLFPEASRQLGMLGTTAAGNAILKAYLTRSAITTLTLGSTILFYRSHDRKAITAIGVVDDLCRSNDPAEIRRFVGMRTVYTDSQIRQLCEGTSVLAILFRHDRLLSEPWPFRVLIDNNLLKGPPQTVQKVANEGALAWISNKLNAVS